MESNNSISISTHIEQSSQQNIKKKKIYSIHSQNIDKSKKTETNKLKSSSIRFRKEIQSNKISSQLATDNENLEITSDLSQIKIDETKSNESSENLKEKNVLLEKQINEINKFRSNSTMDLSSLNITDNDIQLLIDLVIQTDPNRYKKLILRDNLLTSIGIEQLVNQLIQTETQITNLGLSSNPSIGDQGVEHLTKLLLSDHSVTILSLHNTGMTDRGVQLLANVLCPIQQNSFPILEKLYISFNKLITDQSLDDLIRIIQCNQSLTLFSLQHCNLTEKSKRKLRIVAAKKRKKNFNFSD